MAVVATLTVLLVSNRNRNSSNNSNHCQQQPPPAAPTTFGLLDLSRLCGIFVAGVALLTTVLTVTAWWYVLTYETEEAITNDMVLQFSNGLDGWVPSGDNATVARATLLGDLLPILQPEHSKQYFVVLGEKGVGKSTAVRQAIRHLEEPRGVIYVMAPSASANAFLNRLTTATRYREPVGFFELIRRHATGSTSNVAVSGSLWDVLETKLMEVGKAYLAKYNRPPVLVRLSTRPTSSTKRMPSCCLGFKGLPRPQLTPAACAWSLSFRRLPPSRCSSPTRTPREVKCSWWARSRMTRRSTTSSPKASTRILFLNATDVVDKITGGRFALLNSYCT